MGFQKGSKLLYNTLSGVCGGEGGGGLLHDHFSFLSFSLGLSL